MREEDEKCAVYALGEAIHMASQDLQLVTGQEYEFCRSDVTECMTFILRNLFTKHPSYGLDRRK